ncbi:MAG: butyrate kinase, partial [bacterium]
LDGIIITGGIAHSERVVNDLAERIKFIAGISVHPGENELESLAAGGFRAIDGEQEVQIYISESE